MYINKHSLQPILSPPRDKSESSHACDIKWYVLGMVQDSTFQTDAWTAFDACSNHDLVDCEAVHMCHSHKAATAQWGIPNYASPVSSLAPST